MRDERDGAINDYWLMIDVNELFGRSHAHTLSHYKQKQLSGFNDLVLCWVGLLCGMYACFRFFFLFVSFLLPLTVKKQKKSTKKKVHFVGNNC